MADFKKLLVWQKAHTLAVTATDVSRRIRAPEHSSLKSQMIRAAMSIDANISEGGAQQSEPNFVRYLNVAINSAYELESHILMARDTGALKGTDTLMLMELLIEVRRMLYGLVNHIRNNPRPARR